MRRPSRPEFGRWVVEMEEMCRLPPLDMRGCPVSERVIRATRAAVFIREIALFAGQRSGPVIAAAAEAGRVYVRGVYWQRTGYGRDEVLTTMLRLSKDLWLSSVHRYDPLFSPFDSRTLVGSMPGDIHRTDLLGLMSNEDAEVRALGLELMARLETRASRGGPAKEDRK